MTIKKYSKSSAFYLSTKDNFFSSNNDLLRKAVEQNQLYSNQPKRVCCKLCQASLSEKVDFSSHGVEYVFCEKCNHLNGIYEDTQFFVEQLAYIARRLDEIQEGERTALDNSILLFCSSMLTGAHDATQLPVVLVGRGGGQIKTGRVLDYLDKPNRKMCSLYLSLMDKVGIHLDRFGDSTERLTEI